ncbi:hypothetical protein Esti_003800 [Eimeria stiedai]
MAPISWACVCWCLVFTSLSTNNHSIPSAFGFRLIRDAACLSSGIAPHCLHVLRATQQPKAPSGGIGEKTSQEAAPKPERKPLHAPVDKKTVRVPSADEVEGSDPAAPAASPSKNGSNPCRFSAAPLAYSVTAQAEGGAAAAVAAATAAAAGKKVALLAAPRGFCEGVNRAVGAVEEALRVFGPPVYVKHQIVHNEYVCKQLEDRGAIFVEDVKDVPKNSVVVFSAHGVSPEVREAANARGLVTVDATCPLVQKVHVYVQQKAREGYQIVIIGHKSHVEVQGVKGEAPGAVQVVESVEDVGSLSYPPNTKLFYVTQTTLSVLDCMRIEQALREKYPGIETIPSGSVCYATTNRQAALGALSAHAQLALIVGSTASSNAKRLVEVAKARGIAAHLVSGPKQVDPKWLKNVQRVVVSASASTPEELTAEVMRRLRELGVEVQTEALAVSELKPTWKLPKNLRDAAKLVGDSKAGGKTSLVGDSEEGGKASN